jgi:type IV secretion system protein VirD4
MAEKKNPVVFIVGGLVVLTVLAIAISYLAGIAFYGLNRYYLFGEVTPMTWWQYKIHYGEEHAALLKKSMGIAAFAVLALFGFIVLALTKKKQRSLHGAARFASLPEIHKTGLFKETNKRAILVGKIGRRFLSLVGQQFAFLAAPTGGGKGVSVVIPNLLNYSDSMMVLDIKMENFRLTAGFRAQYQKVFLFAPFNEDFKTHRWNPLGYISDDPHHRIANITGIAQILYPPGKSKDAFFDEQARNLFLALALYLCETPELPRTMGELVRLASGKGSGKPIKGYFNGLLDERANSARPLSSACIDAFSRFLSQSENTLASIKGSFDAPLLPFVIPGVDAATSANDFDLRDVRKELMTIYFGISPKHLSESPLIVNLFISQLVTLNLDELPADNPELKYQCLMVWDEFTAPGRVDIIAKAISYMRAYGMRLLTIFQSRSQVVSTYGENDTQNILVNHAGQVLFAPRDQRDANDASELLGYETVKGKSKSRSARGGESVSESDQRRALLLPQEIKEIGGDKCIISVENCRPILADKIVYYLDPVFKERLLPPPVVPALDIELHLAINEARLRDLTEDDIPAIQDDTLDFAAIAADLGLAQNVIQDAAPDADPDELADAFSDEFKKAIGLPGGSSHLSDREAEELVEMSLRGASETPFPAFPEDGEGQDTPGKRKKPKKAENPPPLSGSVKKTARGAKKTPLPATQCDGEGQSTPGKRKKPKRAENPAAAPDRDFSLDAFFQKEENYNTKER